MEKVKIDDVLKYEQPTKYIVETENYDDSYNTPVLTAGKSFLLGYTNEEKGVFNEVPVIIFDDFTTSFHFVDFPFKVKSSALKILKAVKDKADIKYLYYKMQTIKFEAEQHKRYWISKYSQIEIPLPSIATQQRIAAILDQADAIIQNNRAIVQKYDALTQSLFLEMFGDPVKNEKGWEKVSLKYFINKLNTGVSVNSEENSKGDYFILKTSCVYSGIFNPKQVKTIREDEIQRAKLNPKKDSIIISRMNTSELVGKSAYIFENFPNIFLPDRLWQTEKTNVEHSVLWLSYNIGHTSFMNEISKISSGTSGSMKNISKASFLDLKSINPPLKLQNQFAERVAMIEAQKQQAQLELAKSEELFQSLLQRAFKVNI